MTDRELLALAARAAGVSNQPSAARTRTGAAMTSAPKMNLTQFAVSIGLPTSHDVQSHIHAGLRSKPTTKSYQRRFDAELRRLQSGRDEAVRRFRDAVASGEIVDADTSATLERVAQGHPDNQSTQAARRLLEKRRAAQEQGGSDDNQD